MAFNANQGSFRSRLLVADTQPLVTEALVALLTERGYGVAGHANRADEAAGAIASGHIETAIIDIDMLPAVRDAPLMAALTQARRVPIIAIAPNAEHPGIAAAIASGVRGLVLKTQPVTSLMLCLVTILSGGQWHDRAATDHLEGRRDAMHAADRLTRRERDVARLVAAGQRNRVIADALGISEGTVKMHLHNVYAKLGLENRTQLAMDERLRQTA